MQVHSLENQKKRRKKIYNLYLNEMFSAIDDNADWHGEGQSQGVREMLWHCLALLDGGQQEVERANNIIESLTLTGCHFSPMTSMQIMLKYGDKLRENVKFKLQDYVKGSLERLASDRIHYTMYNDNFAAMAIFTLLTAGEMFKDKEAFTTGLEKLKGLEAHFSRNGTITEYGSPTYTAVDTHPLAEMVNYVQDKEVKELARQCEERMWAEIVTHYHAPSGHLAGPYSRAYSVDLVGHTHLFHGLAYLVFGENVFVNPVKDLFPAARENQVIHVGLDSLMWPNIIWLVSSDYHCPDYLAEIFLNKKYPYSVITKSEGLPSLIEGTRKDPKTGEEKEYRNSLEFGGYNGPNTTYMTEDFALGTAYSQFHDGGLTESFYVTYRKTKQARDLTDTGVVFSRYIINDKKPEQEQYYNVYGMASKEGFRDEGRKFGLQYRDCSMMVYKPKQFEAHHMSSMKLSIMFPCHFDRIDEIYLGKERLQDFRGESEKAVTVFVKDGPVYMAFKPLALTNHGCQVAVRIEQVENYIMVSFYNYEGIGRSFDIKDVLLTSSGFITHIKSADEFNNFEEFIDYASHGTVSDKITRQEGAYTRWVEYNRDDFNLHFAYSPLSEGILIETINGHPRPNPIFQATGLDSSKLPFVEG